MTTVAPAASWAVALAILLAAARVLRSGRHRVTNRDHQNRRWARTVLPSMGYFGVGLAVLVATPLGAAHHFYPDVGWGVTATAYLAIGWGTIRAVLTHLDRRNIRQAAPQGTAARDQPSELIQPR